MNAKIKYLSWALLPFAAIAQNAETLPPMTVVGGKDAIRQQVGSAAFVSQDEIRSQNHLNVNRILDRVPGVFVREEDGFGNFPNISLRGAEGTRSEKATIMEDGIPTAPAPYSAPAAYYFPAPARMSGIEVLKGSSQVRYGPHTTGGVINFLSTPIPDTRQGYLRYSFGSHQTHQFLTHYGNTLDIENGRFGYLVELLHQQSDGFRSIEKTGGDTGFQRTEPMLKLFWEPDAAFYQRFEFKIGYSDFEADETYLGLTESDARSNPHRRYAATQFDVIPTEQLRTYLRWNGSPSDTLDLESTLYYNNFSRAWYKLDHVSTDTNPAVNNQGNIEGRSPLHRALMEGNPALGVLKGESPGSIGVKNNNRDYEAFGWQNAFAKRFMTGDIAHSLVGGIRLHYDYVDRFQEVDVYNGTGNGAFNLFRQGIPGEEADRKEETFATAVFLEDSMRMGNLTLKPGVRGEFLRYDVNNRGNESDDTLNTWAAGLGMTYDLSHTETLFGGVYRGISTPGANAYVNNGIKEEESIGYELGLRHEQARLAVEVAGFLTQYDNLVGTDTGLGTGDSNVNAGEATVWGFEGQVSFNAAPQNAGFMLPVYANVTYTNAELDNALATGGSEDIYAGGAAGAKLPYVPEWKFSFGVGYDDGTIALNLDATWVDESFGTANNFSAPVNTTREGKTDDVFLLDLSGSYALRDGLRLLAGVQNLTDEVYVTSRIPHGPRTGAPRSAYVGFELLW
ncbi:MAG: TonB-dependent receptor [Verrucomicrobia bacterium]|nr:TonB-dependent receptor [Verrucomicrobiota bacterium]